MTVCHRTSSARNPYVIINIDVSGCAGHDGHDGDYVGFHDPTCNGQGCFPAGAPFDGTVECCEGLAPVGGVCTPTGPVCGDGVVNGNEQCDGSANRANYTCSPTCTFEICGNGIRDVGEECDDGNTNDFDSCTNACKNGGIE